MLLSYVGYQNIVAMASPWMRCSETAWCAVCQQRLLAEVDLTFEKAMKIAQAMELAERDAKKLQQAGPHPVEPVHKVSDKATSSQSAGRKPPSPDGKPCFRCGPQHDPAQCRFQEVQCHACRKRGHIKKVCCSNPMTAQNSQHRHVHRAQQDTPNDPSEYTLYPVTRLNAKPWQTFI